MKIIQKLGLISLLISLLALTSCKNDLEINGPLESKLAVYGLINWTDTAHYLKIYKTFLTEDNIFVAAQNLDNYLLYDSIEVMLIENQNGALSYHRFDTTTAIPKDSGIFTNPSQPRRQVLYVCHDVLKPTSTFDLQIKNKYTGSLMASSGCTYNCVDKDLIKLPYPNSYGTPDYNPNNPLRFTSTQLNCANLDQSLITSSKFTFYVPVRNGYKYEAYFNFYYWEKENVLTNPNDSVYKGPIKINIGSLSLTSEITPIKIDWNPSSFLSTLKYQLPPLGEYSSRGTDSLHLYVWVAGKEYADFINNNQSSLSIIEDRPTLTNISNGVGMLSSRYLMRMNNWTLHPNTKNVLLNNPNYQSLGFKF